MFRFKKKFILSLCVMMGLGNSLVHAVGIIVPNGPGPYIGVTVIPGSQTSVRINFLDNSDNEDGFRIFDGGDINVSVPANDETESLQVFHVLTGLVCDKVYQVKAVSYNSAGDSDASDNRAFNLHTTFGIACNDEPEDMLNRPGPYIGVTAIEGSKTSVRVNFLDNSANEDGFRIFDGLGINVEIPANDETENPQVYQNLTGLVCDRVYTIKAVAHKAGVDSNMSDPRAFSIHGTFGIPCGDMPPLEEAPIADAGDDKQVEVDTVINIMGTGTDNDGVIVSYKWEENGTQLATTASFDYMSSVEGNHTLVFTVTDNDGLMDSDTMIVSVNAMGIIPPVAVAGDDQVLTEGEVAGLNGSASFDPNGVVVSYEWSEGGTVFANTSIFSLGGLSVGEHTIELKVTDNDGYTDTDILIVNVIPGRNQGVSFHTAFMHNFNTVTMSFFISALEDTTGEITLSDNNETIAFAVTAGDIVEVEIPQRMLLSGTGTVRKVAQITSEKDIVVIGLNQAIYTTDAFLVLPDKLLGKEYYTVGYTNKYSSEFALIATENNTQVHVTLANGLGNLDITLSEGEVYQYQQGAELTGSHITSNKNIAVVSGNECADVPDGVSACDHLVEQVLPVNTWEKEFISVPLKTRTRGDTFRIIASEANSVITINGTNVATLNAGEFFETILTTSSHIISNNPIMVAQYSNGSLFDDVTSDPFMALVPAFNQFDTTHIINTPSGFTDYINIVIPTASTNDIQLDGVDIDTAEFTVVAGTTYSSAQIQISSGKHTVSSSAKFGLLGYGFATYDSYGYPSSLRLIKHETVVPAS